MKKISIFIIICFVICTAFITKVTRSVQGQEGNKPTVLLNDYRDTYTGYYFCHFSANSFNLSGPNVIRDTATICLTKDVSDSIIQFADKANTFKFKLKNKNLYPSSASGRSNGKFFAADSISIYISYGRGSVIYKGKKN